MGWNIYNLCDELSLSLESKFLSKEQKAFLKLILDGEDDDFNNQNKVKCLRKIKKSFDAESLAHIINHIKIEKEKTSLGSIYYRRLLTKSILCLCEALKIGKKTYLGNLDSYNRYARKHDVLNNTTESKFLGGIVVPLAQLFDYRISESPGECGGYVIAWLVDILHNKNPFGIQLSLQYDIKPIAFKSRAAKLYPDLNHLIPLNGRVSFFQSRVKKNRTVFSWGEDSKIYRCGYKNFLSSKRDAIKSIKSILDRHDDIGLYIAMQQTIQSWHAIGIYKDKKNIHVLDANAGWFSIPEENFISWFDFYSKIMGYGEKYLSCEVSRYCSDKKKANSLLKEAKNKLCFSLKNSLFTKPMYLLKSFQSRKNSLDFLSDFPEPNYNSQLIRRHSI